MADLMLRAELEKLARTLGVTVAELAFVSHLDTASLRAMRHALSASLFDRQVSRFRRLADSTRLLPNKLVAMISEKVIPPMISAQVTGLLEPDDAVDLAGRLSVAYQADICCAMDPRRAVPVLQAMPAANVVAVGLELLHRRQFVVMAQFVDALTDSQIQAVADHMSAEGLLHVGFYVEDDARLDQLLGMLSDDLVAGTMIAAAAEDGALWPEVLSMLARLGKTQRSRLGNLLAEASPQVLASLHQALFGRDLWREALPMLEAMNAAAQEVVVSSLVSHAEQYGEHPDIDAFAAALSDEIRRKLLIAMGRD